MNPIIDPVFWEKNYIKIIDQRLLPEKLKFIQIKTIQKAHYAIKTLAVRGAPAIGVAAAYAMVLGILKSKTKDEFVRNLKETNAFLKTSRPTAVNLFWAINTMAAYGFSILKRYNLDKIKELMLKKAHQIKKEDLKMSYNIGKHGSKLIKKNYRILTHCNAGALATSGYGTALAVIYSAFKQGKKIKAYADETRPLLQGARLTAWELTRVGVDTTLICDNMAGYLMQQKKIDLIIVGADRIASNGDFANKIGTYSLAVLAKHHNIPFYTAAPYSTIDLEIKSGDDIPVEQRKSEEVKNFHNQKTAPEKVKVYNPAFDVTPNKYLSGIITEKGIIRKPFKNNILKLYKNENI